MCSATSKDVLYISNGSNIEVVRGSDIAIVVDEDELEGTTMVSPLMTLNIPKIKRLIEGLGKLKGASVDNATNQPPLEYMEVDQNRPGNVEGAQGDEKVIPNTSSYESLDSFDKKARRISHLRKHNVTKLDKKSRKFALGV